ncbi:MAG: aminotransferase class I/II-fold pyridoxal phosphate-dependent enzyme [Gammaproteobacteria bacterium]|nr:aminotransferase class I/II-fold pyridoxal phosphate-dependent enzyme [Gammaproteobacteria bacterium]
MALLDKFDAARRTRDTLAALPLNPTDVVIEEVLSATEAMIQGRRTIMAGTNNYLGLTFDTGAIAAGQAALAASGTGTTGSRMANGTYRDHLLLEREIAAFFDLPYAMVFSTGYSANLGSLAALLAPGDAVLLDSEAHASLFDGCRLSGADIFRFKHNDADSLASRLRRLGERASSALIVAEGLYSIRGDCAPLREFAAVKREFGAILFVDEAHSLGLYGDHGRGLVEQEGVAEDVDFIVGTFSKSLGSIGGFCVSAREELPLFRYASRPYIFTASPCPSVIATTRVALEQLRTRPELRKTVWDNAHRLYAALAELGLELGPDVSPVIGISLREREVAFACWQALFNAGVYTNLILPPAAPDGGSLIRCSVTAAHTRAQIDQIAAAFAQVCRDIGVGRHAAA